MNAGDFIERLVEPYQEAPVILVCVAACIARFGEAEGIPLCKDQVSRLIAIAVCVNAKFWDDYAMSDPVNLNVATTVGISRDDMNAMEMSFLR